ncbi:MAG: HipA family kinase [Candidatus Acidiferrales bacterium]
MPLAIEYIRRMRGGAQSHLLRCSDESYYVVKFQNNPQHLRVLANELLGTRLAARLGLPVPRAEVVEVGPELIQGSAELVMQLGRSRTPCQPGFQFGSRYPGDPAELVVHDFLPDEQLREVENLADFSGMLVFDKWSCNTNGRQAIFFRQPRETRYRALMIDQGFCFNAGEWNFPDAPVRGLYARHRVYETVRGMESFEPWLDRLEHKISCDVIGETAGEIPPEWYSFEPEALERLVEHLDRRRTRARELILDAKKSHRQPFPNWT